VPSPLTQTTGRRKEAVARVRLRAGTGTITINSRAFDNYFTSATHRQMIDAQQTYDIDATIEGGGVAGQAGALRLGISRSLLKLDEEVRPTLKKAGLLTRDSRKKETKKYGLKKARKAPQYSKR
jgi:small subunit ribosomal protein S9